MAEKTVTLAPGESKAVSFEATPAVAKTYQVSVNGLTGSFRAIAPAFDPWSYDTNGDGYIDTSERLKAVQDYYAGIITREQVDQVEALPRPPVEEIDFELARPTVSPAEVAPGTAITITCPVTSSCTKSQTITAKVIIYEGSILPGHGTKIATKTSPAFSISPGGAYNVIVHHTAVAGTIDRRDIEVEVYIAGNLIKQSEWDDVYYVEKPTALVLKFSNPKKGAVLWTAWALDLETGETVITEPSGIQELNVPLRLNLTSKNFLLWVQEFPGFGAPGPYNFGPYVVTIPSFGEYTWNSSAGTIDGLSTIDLPNTSNESLVTGIYLGSAWGTRGWTASISITSSQPVGGKIDAAQYFGSIVAEEADIPVDGAGNPVIPVGQEITAHVALAWGTYRAYWRAWDFKYVLPPAPTYSGSLWGEIIKDVELVGGGYSDGITRVHWTVSPTPGRGFCALFNPYGNPVPENSRYAASGSMDVSTLYFNPYWGCSVQLYANPNPGAVWRKATWSLDGWQHLASYSEWVLPGQEPPPYWDGW